MLHVYIHIGVPCLRKLSVLVDCTDSWNHLNKLNGFDVMTHSQNLDNFHWVIVATSYLFRALSSIDWKLTLASNKVFFSIELGNQWLNSIAVLFVNWFSFNVVPFDFVYNWSVLLKLEIFCFNHEIFLVLLQPPASGIYSVPVWFVEHILLTYNICNNLVERLVPICTKQTNCSKLELLLTSVKFNQVCWYFSQRRRFE